MQESAAGVWRSAGRRTERTKSLAAAALAGAGFHRPPIQDLRDGLLRRSAWIEQSDSDSPIADRWRAETSGFSNTPQPLARDFQVAGDGDRFPDRARRTEPFQRPAGAAKNPLHPGVRHGHDIGEPPHQAEFDHTGEEFIGRSCDAARRLRLSGAQIDAEAAAFPDGVGCRRSLSVQERGERFAKHCGAGRRQQTHTALNTTVVIPLQQIDGPARIEFVDFHVATDLDVPVEPFLENAITKPVHFGELVEKCTVAIWGDELDHVRLLAGLVLRDWRRSAGRPASCAVAQGLDNGTYSVVALEAANLATAWHIVLTPNFIFALSR